MKITPYLFFDGQCEAAFRFYESLLGAKIAFMMPYEDAPDRVLHATLMVGEQTVQGADAPAGNYETPQGFSISLSTGDVAEATRWFDALSEGGKVSMPLQQTFWSPAFGTLTDRFGIPWMINCGQPSARTV